jgi:hypothetical protein
VSTLTKLFIVLHVVLSMLLAAGIVVFVNRVDDYKSLNTNLTSQVSLARSEAAAARSEAQATAASSALAVQAANNETQAVRAQLETANRLVLDGKGQIAQLNAQVSSIQASLQGAQAAVKAAQDNSGVIQAQLIEVRKSADESQKKLLDANLSITDLANRNQVLERQLRNAQEEIAALQEDGKNAAGAPGAPRAAGAVADEAMTAGDSGLNLNGVIRATQTIAGIKYATISIGSADAVRKGMTFRVLGGANGSQFLGYVTVTSVEPHESVGRLSGPRVAEIASDNQVRTRL